MKCTTRPTKAIAEWIKHGAGCLLQLRLLPSPCGFSRSFRREEEEDEDEYDEDEGKEETGANTSARDFECSFKSADDRKHCAAVNCKRAVVY